MTKHLYLMRHGETLFNKRRKIQGWCDSPLTKTGILQAKAAKKCLKDISFDNIVNIIFTKNVNLKITRNVNLLLPVLLTYVYLFRPFLVFQHIHKILGSI